MINYQVFGLVGWLKLLDQEHRVMSDKLQMLALMQKIPDEQAATIDSRTYTVTQDDIDRINPFLGYATKICRTLDLDKTEARVERFQIAMRPHMLKTPAGILDELKTLREALEDDVRFKYFYFYPDDKAKRLLRVAADWQAAFQKFGSCREDAETAVDCYALDRHVACVFHCMMVLEHGLRALAGDVSLSFETQQWNTIIEQIEAEISKLRRTLPAGVAKNEKMQFLSEAAKEFFYFKDGWRNYVSHGRAKYDEHQALSVLEHTRAFMTHLDPAFGVADEAIRSKARSSVPGSSSTPISRAAFTKRSNCALSAALRLGGALRSAVFVVRVFAIEREPQLHWLPICAVERQGSRRLAFWCSGYETPDRSIACRLRRELPVQCGRYR